jgi:hypothetical protein
MIKLSIIHRNILLAVLSILNWRLGGKRDRSSTQIAVSNVHEDILTLGEFPRHIDAVVEICYGVLLI